MNKVLKRTIVFILALYAIYILALQQKMLDTYAMEKKKCLNEINEANEEKEELNNSLEGLNSTEYIEGIARNKLDMYLPNERVYIDITK